MADDMANVYRVELFEEASHRGSLVVEFSSLDEAKVALGSRREAIWCDVTGGGRDRVSSGERVVVSE